MFIIRSIQLQDLKQVNALSKMLNAINLSTDADELQKQIQKSMQSFSGELSKPEAEYIFCLEDVTSNRIIGTAMIIAQHGTKDSPHFFFQVEKIEKFSETIHSGIVHQILKFGYDQDGPTELGGLILHPAFRHTGKHLGKALSWVRFMYVAMHRRRFKDRVLAEFLPPLTSDGKSELWESIGQKFTNLPYLEADKISRKNKEFIFSLFPRQSIYTCLLPARVRSMIGQVGDDTKPATKLLEEVGLKYLEMIDPFDGGPHYGARVKDLTAVNETKKYKIKKTSARKFTEEGLVAKEYDGNFKAAITAVKLEKKSIQLPTEAKDALDVEVGDRVYFLPFKIVPPA
ncbi:MAG: arginine N-succinyltransferase [Deltaproteobacteria bacterium]|nr:arginine N-succinyltransferase [Deltaproteobacteria bacterium]